MVNEMETNGFMIIPEEEHAVTKRRKDLRRRYLRLLDEYPLATKSITSAIIGALGSIVGTVLADKTIKGRLKRRPGIIQWLDVLIYAVYGAIQGPVSHFW